MTRDYEDTIKQLDEEKKRIMKNDKYLIAILLIQSVMVLSCLCVIAYGLSQAEEYYKHQDKVNQENVYVKPR
jgi:hypothetical protein